MLRFWYRLAAHQRRSVAETMAVVTADEFAHWVAYSQLETFDYDGYWQAGAICSIVANALSKDSKAEPEDFMPIKRTHKADGMNPEDAQKILAARFG